MKNFISILLSVFLFLICFVLGGEKVNQYKVMDVVDGALIYLDLNNNGKKDFDELIHLNDVEVFSLKYSENSKEFSKIHTLTIDETTKLGYLAKNYTENKLKNRYVEIKNNELQGYDPRKPYRFAKIYYNDSDFAIELIKEGLAFPFFDVGNDNPYFSYFSDKNLKRTLRNQKEEFFILDIDTNILHKPDCEELLHTKRYEIINSIKNENKKCTVCIEKMPFLIPSKKYIPIIKTSGNITLYLNDPTVFALPSGETRVEACRILLGEINNAKKSVDFAIYGIDNQKQISQALINAKKRNINVRGISDSDETGMAAYKEMGSLKKYIDVTFDNSKYLMHNKFFIIDDETVFTGSMNISKTGCGGYNANSVVKIKSRELAQYYKNEFEQMFKGIFKKNKQDFSSPVIQFSDDESLRVFFSPKGNAFENAVKPEIEKAEKEIRVSIFVLTHPLIVKELIQAKNRGINVKVIADAVGAKNYKKNITELRSSGIKVKVENFGGKDHEKTISIDNKTLIIGSANFSRSGMGRNDENLLVIKSEKLTAFYNEFFEKMYASIPNKYLSLFPAAESFESGNSCFDKLDNDFDGDIDSLDKGCKIK